MVFFRSNPTSPQALSRMPVKPVPLVKAAVPDFPASTPSARLSSSIITRAKKVPLIQETNQALAAITAFANWAGQFSSNAPGVTVMQGEALAWKRREAMRALIQSDPAKALALAVPYELRSVLPAKVTRFLEQQVDGRGDFKVAVATDFSNGSTTTFRNVELGGKRYAAFVYGRRESQVSQTSIPLHGIVLDGQMAVSSEPLRQLSVAEAAALDATVVNPADVICSVSGKSANWRSSPVYAESGGGVCAFAGRTIINW